MADVVDKAISANPIKNGSRVLGTGSHTFQTQDDHVQDYPALSGVEATYENRFDETRYYSGDTSS